ncbi:MAG: NUDIX domain-containing protein [Chloroflexota bacterium]|nr:MAG: NUDIX domain-containing protein [Chloroflexota bacterium]
MLSEEMNFCPRCGAGLTEAHRFGSMRTVCPRCDWVYFADPKVAVAVLIEVDGQVLLVRRSNDPKRGHWTLPAGFVDAGEDPVEAARRECLEETGLVVRITGLIDVLSGQEHARGAHILIAYRGEITGGSLHPGDDADQAAFFSRDALPPLAFETTSRLLSGLK